MKMIEFFNINVTDMESATFVCKLLFCFGLLETVFVANILWNKLNNEYFQAFLEKYSAPQE